jgi:CheY-like chemotaxis protein
VIVSREHPELLAKLASGFQDISAVDVIADRRERGTARADDRRQWSIEMSLKAYGWALVRDAGAPLPLTEPSGVGRIVVVDDHADTRDLTELVLRDAGYEVQTTGDGTAALEVARAWQPDLVVTDIFMKGLDGVELIGALRREGSRTKIIAMSAGWQPPGGRGGHISGADVLDDAMAAGADATLFKPLDPRDLIRTAARLLGTA